VFADILSSPGGFAEYVCVPQTALAEKLEFMRCLGADHVIDYAREDFTRNGRGYDLILDLAAYRPAVAYRRSLMPGGRYLYVGGSVATLLQVLMIGPRTGGRPSWFRRGLHGQKPLDPAGGAVRLCYQGSRPGSLASRSRHLR
jgi:hypothetical protein